MIEKARIEDYYQIGDKIGQGGFGAVYKGKKKGTNKEVAIKFIEKNKIKDSFMQEKLNEIPKEEMKTYIDSFIKEVEIMKIAEGIDEENDNTIKFLEYYDFEDDFVIVMELCDQNLANFIALREDPLSEEEIYMILSQLNNTFRIISSKKIAHRDLKLENILVKYGNNGNTFKVTDYGESKILSKTKKYTQVGTCNFMAPEVLNNGIYNIECDLWSLGIIIHALFFKAYPYRGNSFTAVKNQIKSLGMKALKKSNNPNLNDLISRLLISDPKERMTWKEYFRHPFFKDRNFKNYYELKKKLGGGGFGEVYRAKLKRNNKERAIKIIDITKIRGEVLSTKLRALNEDDMKPYIEGFYNEINIMEILEGHKDNENTVKFYEFFHTQDEFVIVMELCDDNLLHYFSEKTNSFNCKEILDILTQLNNSFKIMVENKLVHRDLKLENILIKKKDNGKIIYKLTDYGISKQLLNLTKLQTKAGSSKFMAPEVEKEDKYNQECDLWSLGVIIHVLFFRDYPEIKDNKVTINSTGDSDLDDLLKNLLKVDPLKRLTWNGYFNHSFFKNNIKTENKEGNPNQIIIKLKVDETDKINNEFMDIYFLESNYYYFNNSKIDFEEENKELKTLDGENTKIFLDGQPINFCKFFKPTRVGEYNIKIVFNNKILNDCSFLFRNCINITSIDLSSFDSSKINNMHYMFGRCFNLEEINFNNFNTEKVTNMSYCFNKCKSLKNISFPSSFNTKKVENMEFMFHFCETLKELSFPNNFIVDNVIEMKAMFGKCYSLEKIDLRNFNTSNVKDMSYMFNQCTNLSEILMDPQKFITKNVTDMGHMFSECPNLKNINLSHFDVQKVDFLSYMFSECNNLTSLDLSNFKNNDTNDVDMKNMFEKCKNLRKIDISSINIGDKVNTSKMFNELTNIEKIIVNQNFVNKYKELFRELEPKFLPN